MLSFPKRGSNKLISISDQDFEQLNFSELKDQTLDKLLSGLKIIGAEPLDPPETDGTVFYLQNEQGNKIVLITEYDIIEEKYIIRAAELKTNEVKQ